MTFKAIYKNGVIEPLEKIDLPENQEMIVHTSTNVQEDINAMILQLAEKGGSFDFLNDPEEDIYTKDDVKNNLSL